MRVFISLLLYLGLSAAIGYGFDFHPRLLISLSKTAQGVFWGVLIASATWVLPQLTKRIPFLPREFKTPWKESEDIIAKSLGEEVFLRGYLFQLLESASPVLGHLGNFLLSTALAFEQRKKWSTPLLKGLQGTALALIFASSRALWVVIVARAVLEGGEFLLLKRRAQQQKRAL